MFMTHPNCIPSNEMRAVCEAARKAAKRNNEWTAHPANMIHSVRSLKNRNMVEFYVTFGGGTYAYWLSSAGVLFDRTSDGFIPVELVTYNPGQLGTIKRTLDSVAT